MFEIPSPGLVAMLRQEIIDTITNFEPRVAIIDVVVSFNQANHYVFVSITFRIVNTTSPITVQFTLDRKR